MKTIIKYIDDLKEKNGSDYRTAKILEVAKETISQIRKRGTVADETAVKIADALGIDRNEVLIAAAIARSHGEVKAAWEKISKMSGIAATVFIGTTLILSNSSSTDFSMLTAFYSQICILC